ncbi:hypothetical protein [Paenibacillus polymyxa]|uniref:hypothetical protein n=1 Tax=Paenibacillus polymyxa TaxID=1406 RepID=UPI001377B8A0|nr:hypothetical protein [Paenibacillus polymyxa]
MMNTISKLVYDFKKDIKDTLVLYGVKRPDEYVVSENVVNLAFLRKYALLYFV